MDKTSSKSIPPHTQVPALHVLFLFIPRERGVGVVNQKKKKKNLNLKLLECIKQNFFLVSASTHQSFLVSPTQQHSTQTSNSRYSMIHQTKVTSLQLAENSWHFPVSYGKGCSKFQLFNPHLFNQRWLLKASLTLNAIAAFGWFFPLSHSQYARENNILPHLGEPGPATAHSTHRGESGQGFGRLWAAVLGCRYGLEIPGNGLSSQSVAECHSTAPHLGMWL